MKSTTASDDVKSYDLVWLLHLVGDVHQPLHAISRFNELQLEGDDGGDLVVVCWTPCTKYEKLHKFWDEIRGTITNPTTAITQAKRLPPVDPQLASITDEVRWIEESFQAAQAHVYVSPIGVGSGPYVLRKSYRKAAGSWPCSGLRSRGFA